MASDTNDTDSALIEHALLQGLITQEQMDRIKQAPRGRRLSSMIEVGAVTSDVARWLRDRFEDEQAQIIGPYRVLGQLGKGGMGTVHHARNDDTGREVALKVLSPHLADDQDFRNRFLREGRNAEAVRHRNVVICYGVGEYQHRLYMAQEYMGGGDLLRRLRAGPLDLEESLSVCADCCRGLQAIATHGFLHRDIKPANIYLDGDGIAKLGDFGLVRNMDDNDKLTRTGVVVGTPAYMSPEQIRNDEDLDERTDVYSLGATLYHMVTGRRPFGGNSVYEVASDILNNEPADPRDLREDLSDHVAAVVFKAMAKKRNERYGDGGELLADVLALMEGREPDAMTGRYVRKKMKRGTKREFKSHLPKRGLDRDVAVDSQDALTWWLVLVGGVFVLAAALALVAWFTGRFS
ncbi:MAG: serine/threonine-protein kinase [Planctomycetota bacterium]|nr:serine/threonine-protein kinase [Planctomycetota bacterium]